jgi:recombination protein RecT
MAKPEQSKELTVPTLLYSERGIGEFRKLATPKHLTPERIARVALSSWKNSADLQKCEPASFLAAVMQSAILGLEPNNALGQAWLIPYGKTCQLIIGYKGLIHLALRSPDVLKIDGFAVRAGDDFDFEYGSQSFIRHKPKIDDLPEKYVERENIRAFWAGAQMRNGAYKFVVMPARDVWEIERRYVKTSGGPWKSNPTEQGIKTAIRRLSKQLPLTIEAEEAVAFDEATERGENTGPLDMGTAEVIPPSGPVEYLTESQQKQLLAKAAEGDGAALEQYLIEGGFKSVQDIPAARFDEAMEVCK